MNTRRNSGVDKDLVQLSKTGKVEKQTFEQFENSETEETSNLEETSSEIDIMADKETAEQKVYYLQASPMPTIDSLTSLEPGAVIDFLHQYNTANKSAKANNGQGVSLSMFISGKVMRDLKNGHGATSDEQIKKELEQIQDRYDEAKKEESFYLLKRDLKWPVGKTAYNINMCEYF